MGRPTASYERDFYAWTQEQAAALRAEAVLRSNAPVDWENVAEEIESMGRSEKREIASRLRTILIHLLKWLYCPELRENCENDWRTTIRTQRRHLTNVLTDNPSLRGYPAEIFAKILGEARDDAADEADVPLKVFPKEPPFTLEQALDPGFPADLFSRDEEA